MNTDPDVIVEENSEHPPAREAEEGFSEEARNMRVLEALLFAADEPLSLAALTEPLAGEGSPVPLLEKLAENYASRGVNLCQVAGGWSFRTAPDLAEDLTVYRKVKRRLSRAALETLAIIAYHQPITRAEVEDVRGVALSRGTLDQLLEAGWIKPKGRRRTPGRPVTWVTTNEFLSHFSLADLNDLPGVEELKSAGMLDPQGPLPGGGDLFDGVDDDADGDGDDEQAEAQEFEEEDVEPLVT